MSWPLRVSLTSARCVLCTLYMMSRMNRVITTWITSARIRLRAINTASYPDVQNVMNHTSSTSNNVQDTNDSGDQKVVVTVPSAYS